MFAVTRGSSLLFGIGSSALPLWDQEDEVAQSGARSDRVQRPAQELRELTSSLVPRGTSIRRLAKLGYSPVLAFSVLARGVPAKQLIRGAPARSPLSNETPFHRTKCGA